MTSRVPPDAAPPTERATGHNAAPILERVPRGGKQPTSRCVVFDGCRILAGGYGIDCRSSHPDDVLVGFLALIRALRSHRVTDPVTLRRDDIEALADRLQLPGEEIVQRLAALMGTTRLRGASMVASYASGTDAISSGRRGIDAQCIEPRSSSECIEPRSSSE